MHFTEYDTRLAAYAAIVDDENRLLLSWWNGEGIGTPAWTMPGGGVEFDEQLPEAVVREVFEETGYHVEVGAPLVTDCIIKPDGAQRRPFKSMRIVFLANIIGGELGTTEVGGSTDYAQWIPLDDVPTLESRTNIVDVTLEALAAD